MAKGKSDGKKKKKKSSQLVIRIEASERDAFVKLCDQMDTTAAREIRRFMRGWVAEHASKSETGETKAPTLDSSPTTEPIAPSQPEVPATEKTAPRTRRKPAGKDAI